MPALPDPTPPGTPPGAELPSLPDPVESDVLAVLDRLGDDPDARRTALDGLLRRHPDHEPAVRVWIAAAEALRDAPSSREGSPHGPAAPAAGAARRPAVVGGIHPDRVGPYRILDVLGEGGMGTVYLAEQRESLRRKVALKVIRAGLHSRQLLRRFQAESQALAMMEHHAIARVYDVGTTDDGRPYFAMEYVDGLPLTAFCDVHRLGIRQRLELFQRVCEGVQHAHDKGIIHRDLKPSNLLVRIQDGRPQPKIIDFGLVRAPREHELFDHTMVTAQGAMLGTPGYMSPEQAGIDPEASGHGRDGGPVDLDGRADVYSLGAILHELLVGRLPWDSRSLRSGSVGEIRRRMRERTLDRPSVYLQKHRDQLDRAAQARSTSPTGLIRRLRNDLDLIVLCALAEDRRQRYASPADLAEDVRRHLAHGPVEAAPPSLGYTARKSLARWGRQILVVVVGAAVVAAAVWTAWRAQARAAAVETQAEGRIATLRRSLAASRTEAESLRRATAALRTDLERTRDEVAAAERRLEGFEWIGSGSALDELSARAETLWPAWPRQVPAMRAWLREAEALRARLGPLGAEIRRLEATPETGDAAADAARAALLRQLERLRTRFETEGYGEHGLHRSMERRVQWADAIGPRTLDAFADAWRGVRERVLADPRFGGFALRPQVGLEPLGPDPGCGLETFLHVASGAPEAPYPVAGRTTGSTAVVFVLVPPARIRGDDGGTVELAPFLVARHELTRGQWQRLALMAQRPDAAPDAPGLPRDLPATGFDYDTCRTVLVRHGLDLPTLLQWQHAARAGRGTDGWWTGDDVLSLRNRANLADRSARGRGFATADELSDGHAGLAPVGSFGDSGANPWSLSDVHGNAAERCRDAAPFAGAPPRDGDGLRRLDGPLRTFAGGSFRDLPDAARLDAVDALAPDRAPDWLGVRPVRPLHD